MSNLILELGATSTDPDGFAIFPSYEKGFSALCSFLTFACKNELRNYHDVTLKEFTEIYAHPPANHPYAENIAKAIGKKTSDLIKTFI